MNKKSFFTNLFKKGSEDSQESFHNLNLEKKDMIRGVFELSETTVKEVLVPRIDVVFLSVDTAVQEVLDSVVEGGHSRFPVYKDTIDNVVGILYVKDLLKVLVKKEEINIEELIRKPFFVPESKRLDALLREFKKLKVHIAVVVDEYGGVSGIVCMEDIIEEIVGEIQDEFDNEVEDILKISDSVFLCDARVNIEDLNEQLGINLSDEDFDTLGGYVFELFGKIPVKNEKISKKDLDFIIQDMEGHKIKSVKIIKTGGSQGE